MKPSYPAEAEPDYIIRKGTFDENDVRFLLAFTALALLHGQGSAQQVKLYRRRLADISGVPAGTIMTKEYVETVGRLATSGDGPW